MLYNDFKGLKVSALGFGAMRLPVIAENPNKPNPEATQQLVNMCMKAGVNYYDTAWGYHGGKSQVVLADCLRRYDRDQYFLANKFPGYDLSNMPLAKEIFEQQLKLCDVDYFDFYLIHNVCELNIDHYLDPKYGIKDYFVRMRDEGKIKHLGFSLHGSMDVLKRFDEAYGDAMEFAQLQLNYLDWDFQDAKASVEYCRERGWPIIVMEPLRGGRLARLTLPQEKKLKEATGAKREPVEWAFNFLQSIPGILTTLTGMSNGMQCLEKLKYYENPRPLDEKEMEAVIALGHELSSANTLPCTSCKYCMPKCPKKLDIPELIARYNEMLYNDDPMEFRTHMAMDATPKDKWPSACIGCGQCAKVCPQQIDIPGAMEGFAKKLGA